MTGRWALSLSRADRAMSPAFAWLGSALSAAGMAANVTFMVRQPELASSPQSSAMTQSVAEVAERAAVARFDSNEANRKASTLE